jgi:hypothetical protein
MISEALDFLHAHGELDPFCSPKENAVRLLETIKFHFPQDALICASITYALHIMELMPAPDDDNYKSLCLDKHIPSHDLNSVVKNWLVSDFTDDDRTRKKVTLKGLANSIKFTITMSNILKAETNSSEMYVFQARQEERARISEALKDVHSWEWDAWTLHAASGGRPMQTLGWHLLHEWGLVDELKLDRAVLSRWLNFVEGHYQKVPYHNSTHATDVLHATHFLLSRSGAADFLPAINLFAVLISAMIHDAGHDGLNNLFHHNAMTDRALASNDQSIQEHYHCSSVLTRTARDPAVDILAALDPVHAREARRLIILITLATDMKLHNAQTRDLDASFAAHGTSPAAWAADPAACDRLCAHVVHAADISNTCRSFAVARGWADRIMREFGRQVNLSLSPSLSSSHPPLSLSLSPSLPLSLATWS